MDDDPIQKLRTVQQLQKGWNSLHSFEAVLQDAHTILGHQRKHGLTPWFKGWPFFSLTQYWTNSPA